MKKKIHILLLGSISVLVVSLSIFAFTYSKVHSLKMSEMELRGETQTWVKKSKQMSTFYNVLEAASSIQTEIQKEYFTPTEEAQIQLISDIEGLIKKAGASGEIKSLEVSPDYKTVVGNISIQGDWNAVFRALRVIEAFPVHINLNDISIAEDGTSVLVQKNASGTRAMMPSYRGTIQFSIIHVNPLL